MDSPGVTVRRIRTAGPSIESFCEVFLDEVEIPAENLLGALDGGWRVYSSGAGILFALVVRHLFGLRLEADALLIDPVLPAALDGVRLRVTLLGCELEIVYRVHGAGCGVRSLQLDGRPLAFDVESNPYRRGAARVSLHDVTASRTQAHRRQLQVVVGEVGAVA